METQATEAASIRVLMVDDHEPVRCGVRELLETAALCATLDEARNGYEVLDKALEGIWDIILLDITRPGPSGLEVLDHLTRERPDQCIVMLSLHVDPVYVRYALQAGAAGYLTKDQLPDELVPAIQAVLAGETYLSRDLADVL